MDGKNILIVSATNIQKANAAGKLLKESTRLGYQQIAAITPGSIVCAWNGQLGKQLAAVNLAHPVKASERGICHRFSFVCVGSGN